MRSAVLLAVCVSTSLAWSRRVVADDYPPPSLEDQVQRADVIVVATVTNDWQPDGLFLARGVTGDGKSTVGLIEVVKGFEATNCVHSMLYPDRQGGKKTARTDWAALNQIDLLPRLHYGWRVDALVHDVLKGRWANAYIPVRIFRGIKDGRPDLVWRPGQKCILFLSSVDGHMTLQWGADDAVKIAPTYRASGRLPTREAREDESTVLPCWPKEEITGLVSHDQLIRFIIEAPAGAMAAETRKVIAAIERALDYFRADCGAYPSGEQGLSALIEGSGISGWRGPYMKRVPVDAWGNPLQYTTKARGRSLEIRSGGADGKPDTKDDIVIQHKPFGP